MVSDFVFPAVAVLLGAALVIWRRPIVKSAIQSQNRFWGFHFGERITRLSEFVSIAVGIGAIILGIAGIVTNVARI